MSAVSPSWNLRLVRALLAALVLIVLLWGGGVLLALGAVS